MNDEESNLPDFERYRAYWRDSLLAAPPWVLWTLSSAGWTAQGSGWSRSEAERLRHGRLAGARDWCVLAAGEMPTGSYHARNSA